MSEPQRADDLDLERDRRSAPRLPADLLGKASVRLLGGSEVTLINFSEQGILFQSETRLLVGARGTIRIVAGTETTIAAGTVVRSLVQGMASGKLAFHTALALDQPLSFAAAIEARERARLEATALLLTPDPIAPAPEPAVPESPPAPIAEPPAPAGKTIEKRSRKPKNGETDLAAPAAPMAVEHVALEAVAPDGVAREGLVLEPESLAPESLAPESLAPGAIASEPAMASVAPVPPDVAPGPLPGAEPSTPAPAGSGFGDCGFGDSGFDGGSFGWSDPVPETEAAGLSVLFVSTTKERTARLQGILAGHRRDIVLTTVMHSQAEAIADIARQHDVLLFDFAIGPDALARTLGALRSTPLGASIAIFVPQQTALTPAVSALANACVIDTSSGDSLVAALRDAAWTPWQPTDPQDGNEQPRDDLFWKAFDSLPVPVLVVDADGIILHANGACAKLAEGVLLSEPLPSMFVADAGPAIAKLIADGLAGGYEDRPVFTARADGRAGQIVLQALSVLPGAGARPELAVRCELRPEATASGASAAPHHDLHTDIAALDEAHDELTRMVDSSRLELTRLRQELDGSREQANGVRRERDELRGLLAIAQRDLERARELERLGAARIAELERIVAEASRTETAAARAQGQLAGATEEIATLRTELDVVRLRATSLGADAERTSIKYAEAESSARQAADELKTARAEAQRLIRERDQAVAAVAVERARAGAAPAARDEGKRGRKIIPDDATASSTAKLQRQIDELRVEVKHEQQARQELEDLLDQNATNLEQTIQAYEERLEALGDVGDDQRPSKPKKTRQG